MHVKDSVILIRVNIFVYVLSILALYLMLCFLPIISHSFSINFIAALLARCIDLSFVFSSINFPVMVMVSDEG